MKFNDTNRQHARIAVAIQLAVTAVHAAIALVTHPIVLLCGIWCGFYAGTFLFLGREHSQGERRIEARTGRTPFALEWWEGLAEITTNEDSTGDVVLPGIVTLVVAVAGSAIFFLWRLSL